MKGVVDTAKQFIPFTVFEGQHPQMQIERVQRDKRLDVPDSCEYAVNDETFD